MYYLKNEDTCNMSGAAARTGDFSKKRQENVIKNVECHIKNTQHQNNIQRADSYNKPRMRRK